MAPHDVTSDMFPYLNVRISIRGWEVNAAALLDTGFTGDVVIPADALPNDIGEPDNERLYRVADSDNEFRVVLRRLGDSGIRSDSKG